MGLQLLCCGLFGFKTADQRGNYMDMTAQKRFGISAAALKWLAVVTMVIDHFALAVYRWLPNYDYNVYFVLRKVGRLAFGSAARGVFPHKECGKVF